MDNDLFVGIVFLDISKAFDNVNHDLLLSHLQDFDLDSVTCQWFHSLMKVAVPVQSPKRLNLL